MKVKKIRLLRRTLGDFAAHSVGTDVVPVDFLFRHRENSAQSFECRVAHSYITIPERCVVFLKNIFQKNSKFAENYKHFLEKLSHRSIVWKKEPARLKMKLVVSAYNAYKRDKLYRILLLRESRSEKAPK